MTFWTRMRGPAAIGTFSADPRRPIAELYCPECQDHLAFLYDNAQGIEVIARARTTYPGRDTAAVEYVLNALVDDEMADDLGANLFCWNNHHHRRITAAICRQATSQYRTRGKKVRVAADPAVPEPVD